MSGLWLVSQHRHIELSGFLSDFSKKYVAYPSERPERPDRTCEAILGAAATSTTETAAHPGTTIVEHSGTATAK